MISSRYWLLLPAAAITVLFWAEATEALATTCNTQDCHQQAQYLTGPFGHQNMACSDCHTTINSTHKDKKTAPVNCQKCHQLDNVFTHAPVAAGDCNVCHRNHGITDGNSLTKNGEQLCLQCHLDIVASKKIDSTYFHPGRPRTKNSCSCLGCHNPHGEKYPLFFTTPYDRQPYVGYNNSSYQLCFTCHQRSLLQFPDTLHYTEFRDGNRNLHFVHVNRRLRGKNCLLCHELHGATNSKLIADTVSYGTWQLPLNYQPNADGGQCAPGCHNPAQYNRTKKTGQH